MKIAGLFGFLLTIITMSAARADDTPSIRDLDWLIGTWNFEDVQVNGTYRETGTRDCEYVLDDRYILCESLGVTNKGKQRQALMYFNYNPMDQRFEMTALFADFPRKNLYTIELKDGGSELAIINESWTAEGITSNHLATIRYNGKDRYVWHLLNGETDPASGERAAGFIDTVTRREQDVISGE